MLPLDLEGNIDMKRFESEIEEKRALEEETDKKSRLKLESSDENRLVSPTDLDILLGRGRPFQGESFDNYFN